MSSEKVSAIVRQYILLKMLRIVAAGGVLDIEGVFSLAEKYPDSQALKELVVLLNQQ